MLGQKTSSMNNLEEQSQNLSRVSQLLVHSPEIVPCEVQEGDDSKNRDSLSEPECLEQDSHPLSAALESSIKESSQAELFLGSPVLDTVKKTEIQELVESCRGGNYLGFLDNIIKCGNSNNPRSPSPGLQSVPADHCKDQKAQLENIAISNKQLIDKYHDLMQNDMIMKSDLAAMAACLENERKSHEMTKKELESTHLCLSEAKKEADLLQGKHRLENQHLKEELARTMSHAKDKKKIYSRISKELKETTLQLEKLECEKDQAVARSQELQMSLHQCREQLDQNSTYNEASQQKIQDLQEENNKLKTNFRKVQQELQQALHSISVNKGTLENTIHLQKNMKEEKAELIKKLDKLKIELDSETKRANQKKEENEQLDLQLKEEQFKNTKYQTEYWKLHSLTQSRRKMLQDHRINEAEMKEMVSELQTQLTNKKALCSQLEIQSKHLQDELDQQLMRNKKQKDELCLQRKQTEAELQTVQQQLQVEKRHLLSQSEAFAETKVQHEQALQRMNKELLMLTKSYESSSATAKRYQKLYNDEICHSMKLASQLRMGSIISRCT